MIRLISQKLLFTTLLFLVLSGYPFSILVAQLGISTTMTPAQMVQNTLLGGGVTVSNVTYSGGAASRGTFTNGGTTNLGLNDGIVLCTGTASQIPHPALYFMNVNLGLPGDAQLDALTGGGNTYDACILEFDFIPLSDTVKFRYVFGSEEYPNYVCSHFNDVFGFFITGVNPSGGNYTNYNIARIPGTALPVAINTVNNGSPGGSYASSGCLSLSYPFYYVDNTALGGTTIAFNGFTTPLTAWCHVTPCQTYHVKLAVGDDYNGLYDSGVFLEASSFTSNAPSISTSYSNPALGNQAIEGCSSGYFSFTVPSPASSPIIINYTVSGSATSGIDYPAIPNSITIPAGQDSVAVAVSPNSDIIAEGTETVIISYISGCGTVTDTIFIGNYTPLNVNAGNDTSICSGSSLTINSIVTGGIPTYSYLWNNGAGAAPQITVNPTSDIVYTVTVTDQCAQTTTSDISIDVISINATITTSYATCGQTNGSAAATVSGSCAQALTYIWNTSPSQSSQNISGLSAGNYTVTVSCGSCTSIATAAINNLNGPSITITGSTGATCGMSDGGAQSAATGGTQPYNYIWSTNPAQTGAALQNVPVGTYSVTVSDANSCTASALVNVAQSGGPSITILTTNEFCGNGQGSATAMVTGGSGNYTFLWNSIPQQTMQTATGLSAGNYTVTLFDGTCISTASCTISDDNSLSASITATPPALTLMDGAVHFTGNSSGNISEWRWSFGDGSGYYYGQQQDHQYDNLGMYNVTLIVRDTNGCTASAITTVELREPFAVFIPNAFTPDDNGLNDIWTPVGTGISADNYSVCVFDRWGKMVFYSTTWGDGWNGKVDNKGVFEDAALGVYSYVIKLFDLNGKKYTYRGSIVLVL
ncbi:MAG: choice-of-anchor L domain-containing protein [Bacteroidota bacterium]